MVGFVNTEYFRPAAKYFEQHGVYTHYPEGTYAHKDFWDEETKRCLFGYEVSGVRITGEHYAYLNYCRIKATMDDSGKTRKRLSFPRFLDMDYHYYHELDKARQAGEGMIIAKARRKGFSFKGAFNLVYRYNWYRESFNIVGAFLKDYSQATMNMGLEMIDFINTNTDWAKRKLIDTRLHVKSGLTEKVNGIEVEKGYKSEIMCMSFKDNAFKAIGKSADLMLFEEAGKWPNLIASYKITQPLFMDGDIVIGTPIIYGTGGDMEGGTQDFAEMFYNPRAYNLRAFSNIYDENAVGECGWFVDDTWFKLPFVDKDGNSDREKAKKSILDVRESVRKSGSKKAYELHVTQNPLTPAEAFLRTSGNVFPVVQIQEQLNWLRAHNSVKNKRHVGKLEFNRDGKLEWVLDGSLYPIEKFPLKSEEDTKGAIVIYHDGFPEDNPPYGKYIAGCDTYDQDKSQTGSLGSIFIYRRLDPADVLAGKACKIVAEYTARPDKAEEFYENVRRLLLYYNATCLYENQLKGLHFYLEKNNCEYLLADSPNYFVKEIIKDSKVERGKGIHMNDSIKNSIEILTRDWLTSNAPGDDRPNLYSIYSIPLLEELLAYNDEGNFDRAIAFMLTLLYDANMHKIKLVEAGAEKSKDNFFGRKLFRKNR